MKQAQGLTLHGSLNPDSLARALRELSLSRSEGVLHLSSDGHSKRVYFKDGWIIFAGSDNEHDRLGEVLIRAGKIERAHLELALRVIQETGKSLGETVVEMGFLTREDLETYAIERTRGILRSVFSWRSGEFYFDERQASVAESIALTIPATSAILEGVRSAGNSDFARRRLGDLTAILRRTATPLGPDERGSLSVSMEWVLHRANGISTIERLVADSSWDEDQTLNAVYSLLAAGFVEIGSPEDAIPDRRPGSGTRTDILISPRQDRSREPRPETIGRYEVVRLLGRGSMGAVYMAKDPTIERTVAIKLIQTAASLGPAELERYRERFYREAKAAGKLLHPGIVAVFDMGHTEDETPFIVLEYVEGKTLSELLGRRALDRQEIARLAVDVLEALAYAHSKSIVHRDVKPSNILVTPDGRAKIMDFGIAYVVGSELTRPGEVLGTPSYMAPEQLSKGPIDQRTDLFAFGVILYRLLTGALPFAGDSFAAVAGAILSEEPEAPQTLDPAIPTELSRLVLRCLSKDPAARFETADELKSAIVTLLQREGALVDSDTPFSRDASRTGSRGVTEIVPEGDAHRTTEEGKGSLESTIPMIGRFPLSSRALRALLLFAGSVALGLSFLMTRARERPSAESDTQRHESASELSVATNDPPDAPSDPEAERNELPEADAASSRGEQEQSTEILDAPRETDSRPQPAPELAATVSEKRREPPKGDVEPLEPESPRAMSDAELFYQAQLALEKGALDESRSQLEELVRRNPSFAGASDLLVEVNDQIWKASLPLTISAKHNHRIGSCRGTLRLEANGLAYVSRDHEWMWSFDEIRFMKRDGRKLRIETFEKDLVGLGRPKNYRFKMIDSLSADDWAKFERLARLR